MTIRCTRLPSLLAWLAIAICCLPGAAAAADSACRVFPEPTGPLTPSQTHALDLLGSVTQLKAQPGRTMLDSNLAVDVTTNNRAPASVRAQALVDAQITWPNANTLADGLGATLADIYRRKAWFQSEDDGLTPPRIGAISESVSKLFAVANGQSAGDSNAGKYGFADGLHDAYVPPKDGILDVLGDAYGHKRGTPGADQYGNSRPFQTAPLDAASGPRIATFSGMDFFGTELNSRDLLACATAPGVNGSDLRDSPSYPSGHTTFAYTEALVLAMMVPERFQALVYRASEYGNSRIVLGAHYPVDVIGGRTLATYDLAQLLAGNPDYGSGGTSFQATLSDAAADLRKFLRRNGCPGIALCARDPIARAFNASVSVNGRPVPASPRDAYAYRLNYGLAPIGATDRPPEPVPEAAGYLLQSRFPYLTPAQRREVLRTTEGPSGYFLDASPLDAAPLASAGTGPAAEAGVYSRLDLFAAAGGYASFDDQVIVDQNPADTVDPFGDPEYFDDLARFDVWSNDISGKGGLTKRGGGTLRLSGRDSFRGPVNVEMGTLEVAGSIVAATHVSAKAVLAGAGTVRDVSVASGGAMVPGAVDLGGAMTVDGALDLNRGSAFLIRATAHDATRAHVKGHAIVDGAKLAIVATERIQPGARFTVLEADGGLSGKFAEVTIDTSALQPKLTQDANAVYVTLEAAPGGKTNP